VSPNCAALQRVVSSASTPRPAAACTTCRSRGSIGARASSTISAGRSRSARAAPSLGASHIRSSQRARRAVEATALLASASRAWRSDGSGEPASVSMAQTYP
jgi:hypothetical protein